MHTIQVHIDEDLSEQQLEKIISSLLDLPHITDVVCSQKDPHDLLIDYEEKYNAPIEVMHNLHGIGLHSDITSA